MALLSNSVRLATFPSLGGNAATSGTHTAERNVYWSSGLRKTFAYGQAAIASVTNRAAVPEGYVPPYCHSMPQKSGGLASRGRVAGEGDITPLNLAGGLNGEAPVSGSGTITTAIGEMLYFAVASLTASGLVNADITALVGAIASLSGAGDVDTAPLLGAINAAAALSGNGEITDAALALIVSALADLSGSAAVAADIVGGVSAVASLSGSGVVTAPLMAIFSAAASLSGSGTASAADLQALANMVSAVAGSSSVTASPAAKAFMTADIEIIDSGVALTANDVAIAVWNRVAEGSFSYSDLVRILAAVAAGQTTIVDNGGGTATVTFRDLGDTKDRVVAEMTGSERTSVVLDGDE